MFGLKSLELSLLGWGLHPGLMGLMSCLQYKHLPEDTKKEKRTRIPYKPNYSLNLWSIMKNCIGKELSKIPMPVSLQSAGGALEQVMLFVLRELISSHDGPSGPRGYAEIILVLFSF